MTAKRSTCGTRPSGRWLIAIVVSLLGLGSATAHGLLPAVLHVVEVSPDRFLLSLTTPQSADTEPGLTDGNAPLRLRFPAHCHQANADLDCRAAAEHAPRGLRGHTLIVEPGPDAASASVQRAELIVVITWRSGQTTSALLRAWPQPDHLDLPTLDSPQQTASSQVFTRYLRLGLHHILGVPQGADHILFLLALMLLVPSLRALLWSVSAFTLGHSLTLAAAALELVRIPSAPVEILIALSIVFLARERLQAVALRDLQPQRAGAYPAPRLSEATMASAAAMAFAFGLLHGLGFATALAEAGLPTAQRALALLSFNLGVELGQLAWVLLWLGPWVLYRRHTRQTERLWLRALPAYVIGCAAAALTLRRLWDLFFPTGDVP